MIDEDNTLPPTQGGNPTNTESSSGNPTHQTPLFPLSTQPTANIDLQALVAALAPVLKEAGYGQLPESVDPQLTVYQNVPILEPYDLMEEFLPSFRTRDKFHAHPKLDEDDGYTDVKHFPRVRGIEYTAPFLPNNINSSKYAQKRDQELATIQTKLANLTRPIDATIHAILSSSPTYREDPICINFMETLDVLRYNLAAISTDVGQLRTQAIFRDKHLIPPTDPNGKTPVIQHQSIIDQRKFTLSLKKATGQSYNDRGYVKGRGRNTYQNYQGSRNYNSRDKPSQDSIGQKPNPTVTDGNQNPNDDTGRQHFYHAPFPRGRGRGRGRQ
ncbi:hypothetical protein BGW38_002966 [Lunasporangiospora selenospora]|uniref:Uncharacterized protein n=1 Tax=Lunasporangiospora selenospora TaxID=979761 RepID=A0A9P6KCJ2_9FUNG|nr:hypothetical protein BGW38_002966 [Lunasporangiospora selenospora]